MIEKPDIFSIIKNDSTIASGIGSFIFALAITVILYLTKELMGTMPESFNPLHFIWLTLTTLAYTVIVTAWRIPRITAIFENGTEVTAQVLESSVFRTIWTIKLHYTHLGQPHDLTVKQLITEKTKHMLNNKELTLIIDQRNPKNILLRDVYL